MTEGVWEKMPVLCLIEVTVRRNGSTVVVPEWIGVEVEFPDQIHDALQERVDEMRARRVWDGYFLSWYWRSYRPKSLDRGFAPQTVSLTVH